MARQAAVLAMRAELPELLFGQPMLAEIAELADFDPGVVVQDATDPVAARVLAGAEILITGWGCPVIDSAVLAAAPRLRAVIHAAGSVKWLLTPECWQRGLLVSTAADANAMPVAEYTLASILLAAKGARRLEHAYRTMMAGVDLVAGYPAIGTYRRTVGVVGASRIGRRVIELLRPFDLTVLVHDPYLAADDAARLGATPVSLPELLRRSCVVTLHAPALPETHHMIDKAALAMLADGSTLINTARGSLVDTDALIAELVGGRLHAVVDVTEPEVLPADSPLYRLPNVVLTPHIAGAAGTELRRLGISAVAELRRLVAGQPLAHPVTAADLARSA